MFGFTYYQQFDEMDCGAACLRMVARHYGREYSLEELRRVSRVGREGVSLLGISEGAEAIGLQTLALPVSLQQLEDDIPLPCILPWRGSHFVVLHRVRGGTFSIADPDPLVGKQELTRLQLVESWSHALSEEREYVGHVLVVEPSPTFGQQRRGGVQAGGAPAGGLRYVLSYLLRYRRLAVNLGAGLLLGLLIQLLLIVLLRNLVDYGIGLGDASFVLVVVAAQGVLVGVMILLRWVRRYLLSYLAGRLGINLASECLRRLLAQPLTFFEQRGAGDILRRVYDHERVREFVSGERLLRLFDLIGFVAFALVLAVWQFSLFLVFTGGSALYLAWVAYVQRRRRGLLSDHYERSRESGERLSDIVRGVREIKLAGVTRQRRWEWESAQAAVYRTQQAIDRLDRRQHAVGGLINHLKNLFVTLLAALAVIEGSLTLGALVAIHYILAQLHYPLESLGETLRDYRAAHLAAERIEELDDVREVSAVAGAVPTDVLQSSPTKSTDLVVHDLDFRYDVPNAPLALAGVSLTIPAGKVTALVGPSGAGKTTLLNLLLGLYRPEGGRITLGGGELRGPWGGRGVGVLSQDGYLFGDTLERNVHLGREPVDPVAVRTALHVVQLAKFVDALPEGSQTRIGPGGLGLSRGQQQRILLARAIYGKPDWVFLDELMAGLDAFSELTLIDNLLDYLSGSTVVMVAHRQSTFERADRIVVLGDGRVVEQGEHRDLMGRQETYYRMVRHQQMLGS